jgi:hypothetical protein
MYYYVMQMPSNIRTTDILAGIFLGGGGGGLPPPPAGFIVYRILMFEYVCYHLKL